MAMRTTVWLLIILCALQLIVVPAGDAQGDVYFARCNLKVLDDNEITWVNWQAAPTFIPVCTKFWVTKKGSKATLVNIETQATYALDIGADGDDFLEKFVTTRPAGIEQLPEDVQVNVRKAIAKIGMTKEQVYIAMGPPTNVGKSRTNTMTYENIMAADLWVYARRRFGKNIGVAFDPASGTVNKTEGIWGKD
jgi:hypothetical protein